MGAFDWLFGGGDQTVTTRTEIDPEEAARAKTVWDRGQAVANLPYQPNPYPRVAPLSDTQMQAGDYLKNNVGNWRGPLDVSRIIGTSVANFGDTSLPQRQQSMPGLVPTQTAPIRSMGTPAGIDPKSLPTYNALMKMATGQGGTGGTWDDAARAKYFNPYNDAVTASIEKEGEKARTAANLRAAAMKAFGGSNTALTNSFIDQGIAEAVGKARASAYDKSFEQYAADRQLGQRDQSVSLQAATDLARMALQAFQGNQQAALTAMRANLDAATGADRANLEAAIRVLQGNQAAELSVGKTNLESLLSTDRGSADLALRQGDQNLRAADFLRNIGIDTSTLAGRDLAQLMGYGALEQTTGQKQLDALADEWEKGVNYPKETLNTLIAAMRGLPYNQSQAVTKPGANPATDVISAMLMLSSIGGKNGLNLFGA